MRYVAITLALSLPLSAATVKEPPKPPRPTRCCAPKVVDAAGTELGEVLRYDDRFPSLPNYVWVRYELKGGDAVALNVTAEAITPWINLGGSAVVFTSSDCSGNAFV